VRYFMKLAQEGAYSVELMYMNLGRTNVCEKASEQAETRT
jgi:hypothetical protein